MLKETYLILDFEDKTQFFFASEGVQGTILKGVIFTPLEGDFWNLAFGDLQNGEIDDSVISNNNDIIKIMNTIAKIVYQFSDAYPTRLIRIVPVDEKRKSLYNHIFRRNYNDIIPNFDVIGTINTKKEPYSPKKIYDKFELKRKFVK